MDSNVPQQIGPDDRLDYFDPQVVEKFEAGVERHRAGDFETAETAYREVLRLTVDHPGALNLIGTIHHQKGDHRSAIEFLDKAIAIAPENPDFHNNRGAAYFSLGDIAIAEKCFREAVAYDDKNAGSNANLASALLEQGMAQAALPYAETAFGLDSGNFRYAKRLADIQLQLQKFERAVPAFQAALALSPDDPETINNLGYTYERLGELKKTEKCYRRALELEPNSPEIANNLASVLGRLGEHAEAEILYKQALNADPEAWTDAIKRACTYLNAGDYARAIEAFEKGVETEPDNAEMWASYASALTAAGRLNDADRTYKKALELAPEAAEIWNNLGNNSSRRGELDEAIEYFKKAIDLSAEYPEPYINLCLSLMFMGKIDEAYMYAHVTLNLPRVRHDGFANPVKIFRGVCDFDALDEIGDLFELVEKNKYSDIAAVFLVMLPLCSQPEQIARLVGYHKHWGENLVKAGGESDPLPPRSPKATNTKLKLAFLSSDLRAHSVSNFVLPILRHYDRSAFEVHCFTPNEAVGDTTQKLVRGLVDEFHVADNMNLRGAAQLIQDQGIDVAFDLNGFTRDTMIKSLAYKPAPVQAYWLGYPFTTGLPEIDYILVDKYFAPENLDWLTEKPLYMPESWVCFDSFRDVAISDKLPVERKGKLTFGTLNNPYKFTPESIATWATIMKEFEDSEFLLVRPEADSVILQGKLREHFERCGIPGDRIKFVNNRKTEYPHFAFYDLIDISLDTFPQTGGTTTCDAIWMGVPVISLVGPSMHQRVSYSLLENAGCGELACFSLEEYMGKAVMLGNDITSMREYRHNMRPALLNSPLCQGERFTENFQNVVFDAFEKSGA